MSPKILITSAIAVVIQFGLAIVGWGGWRPFCAHPALRVLAWATVALTVLVAFTEGSVSSGEKEDRGNRWVLAAFSVIALLLSYFSAYTDRVAFWTLDGDALRWAGLVMFGAGGVLRILPVFVLGRRFSGLVAIQPGHTLETHGMYRVIRNPSYLGLLISSLGWALAFRSVVGVMLATSLLIPLVARMRAEERLLFDHFGAEYDAYRTRTWRLLPRIY